LIPKYDEISRSQNIKIACDTVDHGTLISILDYLRTGNLLLSYLSSYLNSRRQFAFHLSPLLFILFVISLPDLLLHSKAILFVDNIKLFIKINYPTNSLLSLSDLDTFFDYLKQLNLSLNIIK